MGEKESNELSVRTTSRELATKTGSSANGWIKTALCCWPQMAALWHGSVSGLVFCSAAQQSWEAGFETLVVKGQFASSIAHI
jgi:hypothetical protein